MHRTTLWRRKRRGILSPEAQKRGQRISHGKARRGRRSNKILKSLCELIYFQAFKGCGQLTSQAFANLRSTLLGFKLPVNLLAVACCDVCGDPRRRRSHASSARPLKFVSLNRACPTKHIPELNRPLVHYWRKHKSYPIARAVIKFAIKAMREEEGAGVQAKPSVAEKARVAEAQRLFGLSKSEKEQLEKIIAGTSDNEKIRLWEQIAKMMAVCFDQSESETRKNLESIFGLISGEVIDRQRTARLERELGRVSADDLFTKLQAFLATHAR